MLKCEGNELLLTPTRIELVNDQLDTNAANFITSDGYFCIQIGVYLEGDEQLDAPYIELNDQMQSQCGGIEAVIFSQQAISICFSSSAAFLGKFRCVKLNLQEEVSRVLVDFFNNKLFLGSVIKYSEGFNTKNICTQISKRSLL